MMKSYSSKGFTLAEIVITLAIVSTVIVSLLALLPAGMQASNEATERTITAVILEDLHDRFETEQAELREGDIGSNDQFFYDQQGVYIPPDADGEAKSRRFFWAEASLLRVNPINLQTPGSTSQVNTDLMAIRVELWWPVDPTSGQPLKDDPGTTITYYATSLAGVDWEEIDPDFRPRIEF
ncbi:MAG: prepilin-type N-terminal cleavage/methylation domain-containing protein [Verrucomicrobiota bacterium]